MSDTATEAFPTVQAPPTGYTNIGANAGDTCLQGQFMQSGTATVIYSPGPKKLPTSAEIVHQDGKKTPVVQGQHDYVVHAGDSIKAYGACAECKFVWYFL